MVDMKGDVAREGRTSDPVAWAERHWRQQGFVGDPSKFLAASSLLRYQRLVFEAIDGELKSYELNMTDYLMLMSLQLSEAGTRLASSLARNLMVHATTATLAIDRLEARGLLARSPHPTDRRAIHVTISGEGRDLIEKATLGLEAMDFGLKGAPARDVKAFRALLDRLRFAGGDIAEPPPR